MKKSWIEKIEHLFEQDDIASQIHLKKNPHFKAEENFQLLENIMSGQSTLDWNIFFSRLCPFFEMGFYIEKKQIKHFFFEGDLHESPIKNIKFNLPQSTIFHILKTPAKNFLKKLGLQEVNPLDESEKTCLLIRINKETYMALISELADPWLKLRAETLKNCILKNELSQ